MKPPAIEEREKAIKSLGDLLKTPFGRAVYRLSEAGTLPKDPDEREDAICQQLLSSSPNQADQVATLGVYIGGRAHGATISNGVGSAPDCQSAGDRRYWHDSSNFAHAYVLQKLSWPSVNKRVHPTGCVWVWEIDGGSLTTAQLDDLKNWANMSTQIYEGTLRLEAVERVSLNRP